MAQKIKKVSQDETAAPTAEAPVAQKNAPKSVAELAKMAAQQRAERTPAPKTTATLGFNEPPKGADKPKGVAQEALLLATKRAKEAGPAVYLVEVPNKRGHHAIIVVNGDQVATHGGCVQASRAVYFGKKHAQVYGLELNASLASSDVQALL